MRVLFRLNASLKKRLCLFSFSNPRLKEKKALEKDWAVSQRSFYLQEKSVASKIYLDFAVIFGIFISLVSISGNIHNTFLIVARNRD